MELRNFLNLNVIQNALGFKFNEKRFIVYMNDSELLSGMSVLNYSVRDDSQFATHPIETGATIADHHIFNPVQITCNAAFPPKGFKWAQVSIVDLLYGRGQTFDETFNELETLYKTSAKLTIKTDAKVYENMYLTSIPSDVSPDNADRQIFSITFEQALMAMPQYVQMSVSQVKNPSNASYVKGGEKLPAKADERTKTALKKGLDGIFGS